MNAMIAFAAVATLLALAVLLCLLPPLLRRDPGAIRRAHDEVNLLVLRDQARELDANLAAGTIAPDSHASARQELAGRVVQDVVAGAAPAMPERQVRTAAVLALAVPLFVGALYLYVGNPDAVTEGPRAVAAPQHDTPASIEAMVATLAQRLQATPDDVEGLQMLARSYTALDRHQDAARTYARLAALLPGEAGVLADYADALGTAEGATLQGEPERLIARALAIDPQHVKALSLSGSAAFERGQFARARQQWQAVLALLPADSAFAQSTAASVEAAARSERLAGGGATDGAPITPTPIPTTAARALSGTVRIAPALLATLKPTDTVFVYARLVDAKGPPLAALRRQVRDLPLQFSLDDSMGTGTTAPLSQQARVMVGARISRSGSATPASGDPEGIAGPVASDARDVTIDIQSRRQ